MARRPQSRSRVARSGRHGRSPRRAGPRRLTAPRSRRRPDGTPRSPRGRRRRGTAPVPPRMSRRTRPRASPVPATRPSDQRPSHPAPSGSCGSQRWATRNASSTGAVATTPRRATGGSSSGRAGRANFRPSGSVNRSRVEEVDEGIEEAPPADDEGQHPDRDRDGRDERHRDRRQVAKGPMHSSAQAS